MTSHIDKINQSDLYYSRDQPCEGEVLSLFTKLRFQRRFQRGAISNNCLLFYDKTVKTYISTQTSGSMLCFTVYNNVHKKPRAGRPSFWGTKNRLKKNKRKKYSHGVRIKNFSALWLLIKGQSGEIRFSVTKN